jgi:hypothetical protein
MSTKEEFLLEGHEYICCQYHPQKILGQVIKGTKVSGLIKLPCKICISKQNRNASPVLTTSEIEKQFKKIEIYEKIS